MAAATFDLTGDRRIEQGATYLRTFTRFESDGVTPVDLTGVKARMQIRQALRTSRPMLDATTENGMLVIGGPDGTVTLQFSAETTDKLLTDGVYDLELVHPSGFVERILEGEVQVSLNVTR